MKFEILYFDGCPSWQDAEHNLQKALDDLDLPANIKRVQVETPEEAIEKQFIGSPTIRVDGEDLFPASHDDYALGCRVYDTAEGLQGAPTISMLRDRLKAYRKSP